MKQTATKLDSGLEPLKDFFLVWGYVRERRALPENRLIHHLS